VMPLKTSFFVTVVVQDSINDYKTEAQTMKGVLMNIFTDSVHVAEVTKQAELQSCHTEIEISVTPDENLVARSVIDMEAENRVQIDKSALTKLIRKAVPWKNVKIEKRAVPDLTLVETVDLVDGAA
jgi:hypothetical protein